ncbi:MAG: LUD domain-containing protein [Bacteroidetes bacterium]|nr:LUD domain-containing protein [Bacteroidota bacterium]MBS1685299.1 LUD domain-containing protein [Bacteroidota bacterium]
MYTEDSNSGFLGNLRNLFSSKKTTTQAEAEDAAINSSMVEEYIPPVRNMPVEIPQGPMGTRTVDFSHVAFTPVTKVVEDVQATQAVQPEDAPEHKDLDIQFASALIEKGGKFIYCESLRDVVSELKIMAQDMGWAHVFCWENEIKDAFCENDFQKGAIGFTLENSNAAICLCETLVADTGNLILNPKQASRRRLPVFPKTQIFLADTTRLAADLNKAIDVFNLRNRGELPSVLDLTDNAKGHYYHDGNLVLKAEGTSDIYVFLIDEKIKPSQRS